MTIESDLLAEVAKLTLDNSQLNAIYRWSVAERNTLTKECDEMEAEVARLRAEIDQGSVVMGVATAATSRAVFAMVEIRDRITAQSVYSTDPQATLDDIAAIAFAALAAQKDPT